jgi:hypothetical protein
MKKFVLLSLVAAFLFSCGNSKQNNSTENLVVYSVDELYDHAFELEGQEITVKGTVMHVCKHGGGRCFLMGSNEDFNIRIEAGEKIGAFSQKQMGSDLTVTGILKEVRTMANSHHRTGAHGEKDHGHDGGTEEAQCNMETAGEKADVIYYVEGLQVLLEE